MKLGKGDMKEALVIPADANVVVRMSAYVLVNGDMLFSVSSAPGVSEQLLPDILLRMRETADEGLRELKEHGHEPTFAVLTELERFDVNALDAKNIIAALNDDCPCSLCTLRRTLRSEPKADRPNDLSLSEPLAGLTAEISKLPGYKQ